MWHDPPEYYDHPRGYLTYTPYVPSDLVKYFETWNMPDEVLDKQRHLETLQKHFALLNIQVGEVLRVPSHSHQVSLYRFLVLVGCSTMANAHDLIQFQKEELTLFTCLERLDMS